MDVTTSSPDRRALLTALQVICDRLAPDRHGVPFIDLNALAKRLGVRDILYSATRMHGYTDWTNRGAVIRLAISKTEGRRRMTLAHECAHLLFNPLFDPQTLDVDAHVMHDLQAQSELFLDDQVDILRRANAQFGIEKVCDLIAFELLLPRTRAAAVQVSDAGALMDVAGEQHVSATLLVHQLNAAGHNLRLARMARIAEASWMIVDAAGKTGAWQTARVLNEPSSSRMEALRTQREAHMSVPLNVADPSPTSEWIASVLRRSQSAFALTGRGTAAPGKS